MSPPSPQPPPVQPPTLPSSYRPTTASPRPRPPDSRVSTRPLSSGAPRRVGIRIRVQVQMSLNLLCSTNCRRSYTTPTPSARLASLLACSRSSECRNETRPDRSYTSTFSGRLTAAVSSNFQVYGPTPPGCSPCSNTSARHMRSTRSPAPQGKSPNPSTS